eukprot:GEMP01014234.1.p1 GENE.GEMP01014234.1~~GEMP01014234.1.p1  ORF type:complete len:604 (+),score=130.47 GEMP01014234.1:202-2013(+)
MLRASRKHGSPSTLIQRVLTRVLPKRADVDSDGKITGKEAGIFVQGEMETRLSKAWERRYGGDSDRFPGFLEHWGRGPFFITGSGLAAATVFACASSGSIFMPLFIPTACYWALGIRDIAQRTSAIRHNFPVIGNMRSLFESIRPEIRQYFIEGDHDENPFSRANRSVVYKRAKNLSDTQSFGTRRSVYEDGYTWFNHSTFGVTKLDAADCRTLIGDGDITYNAALLNVSGMSFGALSNAAVTALNKGAKKGGFYHNTGEGGISDWHRSAGADVVWNVGTGYFGCRTIDGQFSREKFLQTLEEVPQTRMIELKLSQGAKPGHGGMLPGGKVTEEIARIRGIPAGEDCHSPPMHSAFKGPRGLADFITELRELSQRPVGVKVCVGNHLEIVALIRAIKEANAPLDFITVDGGEGGTGAAPFEFSNHVGTPLADGIVVVDDLLRGAGMRQRIKIIGSGKVASAYGLVRTLAYGADMTAAARSMLFAIGCIQALQCNTNTCPTGITTQDPALIRGLNVPVKGERVYNFQKNTVAAACDIMGAMGCESPQDVEREHLMIRIGNHEGKNKSFETICPTCPDGVLLEGRGPAELQELWDKSTVLLNKYR